MEYKLWWPELARQPQKGMRASGHIANVKACLLSATKAIDDFSLNRHAVIGLLYRCHSTGCSTDIQYFVECPNHLFQAGGQAEFLTTVFSRN